MPFSPQIVITLMKSPGLSIQPEARGEHPSCLHTVRYLVARASTYFLQVTKHFWPFDRPSGLDK